MITVVYQLLQKISFWFHNIKLLTSNHGTAKKLFDNFDKMTDKLNENKNLD